MSDKVSEVACNILFVLAIGVSLRERNSFFLQVKLA